MIRCYKLHLAPELIRLKEHLVIVDISNIYNVIISYINDVKLK